MAKQIFALAFILFFAAVGMATAQENNVPAAAAGLAPAAAAAGLHINNPDQLVGALQGAAKDGAPIGGPIPEDLLKHLAPPPPPPTPPSSAATEAAAAAGTTAAAGVVGSLFLF